MNTLSIFINEYASVNILSANVNYYLFEMRHPVCQGKVGVPLKIWLKKVNSQKIKSILASYIKTLRFASLKNTKMKSTNVYIVNSLAEQPWQQIDHIITDFHDLQEICTDTNHLSIINTQRSQ